MSAVQSTTPQSTESPVKVPVGGTLLIALGVILLCFFPKLGADLFWQIRVGEDILRSHAVPRADHYSWTRHGHPWDTPEWLSFVVFALAYKAGGFFGTFLMMVALTVAQSTLIWIWLVRRTRSPFRSFVLINLMLMALSQLIQERPWLFTTLFLTISLMVIRVVYDDGKTARLFKLVPLVALWTNLHQGFLVLVAVLGACAIGDIITAIIPAKGDDADRLDVKRMALHRAGALLSTAALCIVAGMVSPYGWHVYKNVLVTILDPNAMTKVTEWLPVTSMPPDYYWGFYTLATVTLLGYVAAKNRGPLGLGFACAGLLEQAWMHQRNVPFFAIATVILAGDVIVDAAARFRPAKTVNLSPVLIGGAGLIYLAAIAKVSSQYFLPMLSRHSKGMETIGEAIIRMPGYPSYACDFMDAEGFPSHLRLYNNYDIGGYLVWRMPHEPVFVDGRADVYLGDTLNDYEAISAASDPSQVSDLLNKYDFDCVITSSAGFARVFMVDPAWHLVYAEPSSANRRRAWILLRDRPQFSALIEKCNVDFPRLKAPE